MAPPAGQRNTTQRKVILEELRRQKTHPTATELYELVRRRLPHISLGTVYRNLELLACNGIIGKIERGREQARFDGFPGDHHHVRCSACGRVEDVHGLSLEHLAGAIAGANGYEITGHTLEFIGLCPDWISLSTQRSTQHAE